MTLDELKARAKAKYGARATITTQRIPDPSGSGGKMPVYRIVVKDEFGIGRIKATGALPAIANHLREAAP